jgi:hypothetical protein
MPMPPGKYIVLRKFVPENEASALVKEVLTCHETLAEKNDYERFETLESSKKLELGIPCGGDLSHILTRSIPIGRQAFQVASDNYFPDNEILQKIVTTTPPLSGLALLYGIRASMTPHYDSPTQPGQREEWLVMITLGNSVHFRCNDETIRLDSGDALVMDSMATLHGVETIVPGNCWKSLGMPFPSRLGILFWQGRVPSNENEPVLEDDTVDGLDNIFRLPI